MPDTKELHLSFFQNCDTFNVFVEEPKILSKRCPLLNRHVLSIRKSQCLHIWWKKISGFANVRCVRTLFCSKPFHIEHFSYIFWQEKASSASQFYLTGTNGVYQKNYSATVRRTEFFFIIDGADRFAGEVSRLFVETKAKKGWDLKGKLVGLLTHGTRNHLYLLILTDRHETGANHIITTLNQFINNQVMMHPLPKT